MGQNSDISATVLIGPPMVSPLHGGALPAVAPPVPAEHSGATLPTTWQQQVRIVGWLTPLFMAVVSGILSYVTTSNSWFLSWPGMLVVTFATVTAWTDSRWRKIPNWMTYPACLAGLVIGTGVTLAGASNWMGTLNLQSSFFGLIVCFCCMLFPYRASGGGAGDVKLGAAYGALLGWDAGLSIIIWAYLLAGSALLIVHLASEHPWLLPRALLRSVGAVWLPGIVEAPSEAQRKFLARPIPLAGAFAVGLVCVLCGANLFSY
jgi:Flp pilus assembly protein protease CpaA